MSDASTDQPTDPSGDAERVRLAASFGAGGDDYERLRPGYPARAVGWLVPSGARRVADIGAGTGKFARLLAGHGHRVVAVDPSADMLRHLADAGLAGIETVVGTGEATGLDPRSVDAVVYAQSWHWVEPVAANRELLRILTPGGTLGLIWNQLDTDVAWVARYAEAMHSVNPAGVAGIEGRSNPHPVLEGFETAQTHWLPWQQVLTRDDLLALPGTRSYWRAAAPANRERGAAAVAEAVAAAPHTADGRVALPYLTQLVRLRLAS